MVRAVEGVNLPLPSTSYNLQMIVTAVDSNGNKHTRTSAPELQDWVHFGEQSWQLIRVKAVDEGTFTSSDITGTQTFPMKATGYYQDQRSCYNIECTRYVKFKYALVTPVRGTLQVIVKYARDLPDMDSSLSRTNPYVTIGAMITSNHITYKNTEIKYDTQSPTWNQELTFEPIMDSNSWISMSYDSPMSTKETCVCQLCKA